MVTGDVANQIEIPRMTDKSICTTISEFNSQPENTLGSIIVGKG